MPDTCRVRRAQLDPQNSRSLQITRTGSASVKGIGQENSTIFLCEIAKTLALFHCQKILCSKPFPGENGFLPFVCILANDSRIKARKREKNTRVIPSLAWFWSKENVGFPFSQTPGMAGVGGRTFADSSRRLELAQFWGPSSWKDRCLCTWCLVLHRSWRAAMPSSDRGQTSHLGPLIEPC